MAAESYFLPRDEFINRQNRHDDFLNKEFLTIRHSINQVKSELQEFKGDVDHRFDDVNRRFDDVNRRFDDVNRRFEDVDRRFDELKYDIKESKAESLRNTAYMRNNALRHPKYPIRPISAIHGRDINDPDSLLFPRHADEFYALRDPSTDHQRRMLAYLVSFYDMPQAPHATSSDSDDDDDDDTVIQNPEDAVDFLEAVLGLNEDNFIKHRQRALEFANRPHPPPIKRSQLQPPEGVQHPLRLKTDPAENLPSRGTEWDRPRATTSDRSDSDHARLGWGERSTPSSQRRTVNELREKSRDLANNPKVSSDAGSTTNPNTSEREEGG